MELNLHQKVLAYAALHEDEEATISYKMHDSETRAMLNYIRTKKEFDDLVKKFKEDPKKVLAYIRINMFNILKDQPDEEERLDDYIPDYFDLMCMLDEHAFPSTGNKVYNGTPEYVMDGLSDMGSDKHVESIDRYGRDKIKVNKREIFEKAQELFKEVYQTGGISKKNIHDKIQQWIRKNIPYDHLNHAKPLGAVSVPLELICKPQAPLGVCRHIALYEQVLSQAFGLTSLLLKCKLNGIPHVANLSRIDRKWYLKDPTNPLRVKGRKKMCLVEIPEKHIDLNKNIYEWTVNDDKGVRLYRSRNNMYYRIDRSHRKKGSKVLS